MNMELKDRTVELALLETVEKNQHVTQRELATHLGVALGVANACLKSCIRKGLVKIEQTPSKRYLYFLTPQGFIEKSKLSVNYIKRSLKFYTQSSQSVKKCLSKEVMDSGKPLILYGLSDLTEIALLWAKQLNIHVACVLDVNSEQQFCHDIPICQELPDDLDNYYICFTALDNAQRSYQELSGRVSSDYLLVPDILSWVRPPMK